MKRKRENGGDYGREEKKKRLFTGYGKNWVTSEVRDRRENSEDQEVRELRLLRRENMGHGNRGRESEGWRPGVMLLRMRSR